MDEKLLEYLYEAYERGNYAHQSLNEYFRNTSTIWENQNSIADIKDRILRMVNDKLIEINADLGLFKGAWGVKDNGVTFDYTSDPVSARILKVGVDLIQGIQAKQRQQKVDKSLSKTNKSIRDLNTTTTTFYTRQRNFNRVQIGLTIALLVSSIVYSVVSIFNYKLDKSMQPKEQRLQKLENKLQQLQEKDSVFKQSVLDSLKSHNNTN